MHAVKQFMKRMQIEILINLISGGLRGSFIKCTENCIVLTNQAERSDENMRLCQLHFILGLIDFCLADV
jgi:hypothetical protein